MNFEDFKVNVAVDKAALVTLSEYHQFVRLKHLVVKRYAKTIPGVVTALRADYWNSKYATPAEQLQIYLKTDLSTWDRLGSIPFRYEDNVIELYSPEDVSDFERFNRKPIAEGTLVEYVDGNYEFQPQDYNRWSTNDDTVVLIPKDFRLVEKKVPVNHNIAVKPLKRG